MNKKHLSLALSILFACFVALSAACTTPAGRTADEVVGDTGVTAQIKTALIGDPEISGFAIGVDTFNGEVVLTGAVDSQAQINTAVSIARSVKGVNKVTSHIKIKEKTFK